MSRARNIKPGFFRNEELVELPIAGRLLFIGLWCEADRRGILEDRPKKLKLNILPFDDCDPDALLEELKERGFIERYAVNGARCIKVVNFSKHQNPHQNEKDSDLPDSPATTDAKTQEDSDTTLVQVPEHSESTIVPILLDSFNLDSLIPESSDEKKDIAPNGAVHVKDSDKPPKKKPLPTNGAAQRIVAAFCVCAGIDEPASYAKAAGQAQLLAKAGVTPEDVPSLFSAANWGDGGVDLGKMLGSVDRWRSAKTSPPPPRHVKYPDPLQKRIDNWTTERVALGLPILPFAPPLQATIDDFHASLKELGKV